MRELEPPAVPDAWWSPAERMMFVQHLDTVHDGEGYAVAELPADAIRLVPDTGRPATEPFLAQLRREQAAIHAHHARGARRRLHWVWDLGHRKPWRSSGPVPWRHLPSLVEWVRNAHDCSDASLMCSCAGGPRFPRRDTTPDL